MKRFIRYLYEYDQGKRLRNVGFVKVEQGEDDCTLHIHGKGLHMKGERQLALYMFYCENDECIGIYQGTADNVNPAINYRLYYTKEDVIVPDNFQRIGGIILESELGHRYAAIWNDSPVDVEHMRVLRPEDVPKEDPAQREGTMRKEASKQGEETAGEETLRQREETAGEEASKQGEETAGEETLRQREETMRKEASEQGEEIAGEEALKQRDETVQKEESLQGEETVKGTESLQETRTMLRTDTLQGINSSQGARPLDRREDIVGECAEDMSHAEGSQERIGNTDASQMQRPAKEQTRDVLRTKVLTGEDTQNASLEEERIQEDALISQESMNEPQEDAGRNSDGQNPKMRFRCTKITRNDLARLPRCEWKWANNSFLLHGYYNYHHLALIDDGEKFRLGVPGIYHPQEAKAASTFGFTEFVPYQDMDMDLTDDEKSNQEQFGYWCRQVKRPLKM